MSSSEQRVQLSLVVASSNKQHVASPPSPFFPLFPPFSPLFPLFPPPFFQLLHDRMVTDRVVTRHSCNGLIRINPPHKGLFILEVTIFIKTGLIKSPKQSIEFAHFQIQVLSIPRERICNLFITYHQMYLHTNAFLCSWVVSSKDLFNMMAVKSFFERYWYMICM